MLKLFWMSRFSKPLIQENMPAFPGNIFCIFVWVYFFKKCYKLCILQLSKWPFFDLEICCRIMSKMKENASQVIKNTTAPEALCLLCLCLVASVADSGRPRGLGPLPLLKLVQKKMAAALGRKFRKSSGPPQTNFWIRYWALLLCTFWMNEFSSRWAKFEIHSSRIWVAQNY